MLHVLFVLTRSADEYASCSRIQRLPFDGPEQRFSTQCMLDCMGPGSDISGNPLRIFKARENDMFVSVVKFFLR